MINWNKLKIILRIAILHFPLVIYCQTTEEKIQEILDEKPEDLIKLLNFYHLAVDEYKIWEKDFRFTSKSSAMGDLEATYMLGLMYAKGFQCNVNYTKAIECFKQTYKNKKSIDVLLKFSSLGHELSEVELKKL